MKILIINAESMGLCGQANRTIERLLQAGAVTAVSLIPNASDSEDAIERIKACGENTVGVQWALNSKYPDKKWKTVSSFAIELTGVDGYLYQTVPEMLKHADSTSVLFELEAQLDYLTDRGLTPVHADCFDSSLLGIQGPSFMMEAFTVCGGHHIPFSMPLNGEYMYPYLSEEEAAILEGMNMIQARELQNAWLFNIKLPKVVLTYLNSQPESYEVLKQHYIALLQGLQDGITLLNLTPMDEDEETKTWCEDWQKRAWDAQLLTDPDFIKVRDEFTLMDFEEAFQGGDVLGLGTEY